MYNMLRHGAFTGTISSLALVLATAGCSASQSGLPPLLRGLRAGGWENVCPWKADDPALAKEFLPKISPPGEVEFTRRLSAAFPVGTSEDRFLSEIKNIGFGPVNHCDTDPTIHFARFDEKVQSSFDFHFPLTAFVYWKSDAGHKLLWTKGNVSYTGP
jgi:hypothetical protein